jgi:bifunctional non-homologous end joining protein LigD
MARLKTYHTKRKFDVTAEPKGKVGAKAGNAFVIQKHDATRLHYDLRLELDGVMKSWAVTRGPSLVPGEKRLAVQVEDHPIEYNQFEGTIPKGQYGGGTVMIWDRGTWTPEYDAHKGLAKGHLSFALEGEKLHGGWHLVRMHRRPGEKRDNWLLIKQEDDAARKARDKDILEEEQLSVKTGRSLDEIAAGAKNRTVAKKAAPRQKSSAKKKKASAAKKKATPKRKAKRKRGGDPLPDFVPPALATLSEKAPQAGDWVHEIKFDGYRVQARLEDGKVKLLTRKGLDWTHKFPTIAAAVAELPADTALIDGEITVNDEHGVSGFSLLQQALKDSDGDAMHYYAFDLLHLNGTDMRPLPVRARKAALAGLIGDASTGPIHLSESLDEPGPLLVKHACKLGLEGIISKRADASYHSGRGYDWLKTKCSDRQEFVITGFLPSTADKSSVGALVLGVYDGDKLIYAGRTGTGFTHQMARDLFRKFKPLVIAKCPFGAVPQEERGARSPVWMEPKLVAEIDFHGWTHGDRVRQSSFQGLREDKQPKEVVREMKSAAAVNKAATASRKSAPVKAGGAKSAPAKSLPAKSKTAAKAPPSASRKTDNVIGGITLTHPGRVYWEDVGITKRGLAEFYAKIWKWMAPHLVGRPISLLRCPEGAAGQCFFQKHASAGISADNLHLVDEDGDKILSLDNLDGLLALVQAGVLEVHVRGSTIDHLPDADRLVFDLDPGPGTSWKDIVAAARDVKARLEKLKLKTFLKTSGGKGLHVILPIAPTPWAQAKNFCHAIAAMMEQDAPERYVSTSTKSKRHGRIFVDYLRNSREATAVAPYSTRARPGAGVSVPIDWSELGTLKSADQYTVKNLPTRLARLRKDPWSGIGRFKQKLPGLK